MIFCFFFVMCLLALFVMYRLNVGHVIPATNVSLARGTWSQAVIRRYRNMTGGNTPETPMQQLKKCIDNWWSNGYHVFLPRIMLLSRKWPTLVWNTFFEPPISSSRPRCCRWIDAMQADFLLGMLSKSCLHRIVKYEHLINFMQYFFQKKN